MKEDSRAVFRSLNQAQKDYVGALACWIGEFGATSPYSKMQREEEEKEQQSTAPIEPPKYRLGMGHAYAIAGISINQRRALYQKNLARHNFAIFETRGRLYQHEAEAVHDYFRKLFESRPDKDLRLRDMESALTAVQKAFFGFSLTPIWPTVTNEDRHKPPLRPDANRILITASGKRFDTATYTG